MREKEQHKLDFPEMKCTEWPGWRECFSNPLADFKVPSPLEQLPEHFWLNSQPPYFHHSSQQPLRANPFPTHKHTFDFFPPSLKLLPSHTFPNSLTKHCCCSADSDPIQSPCLDSFTYYYKPLIRLRPCRYWTTMRTSHTFNYFTLKQLLTFPWSCQWTMTMWIRVAFHFYLHR